MISNKLLLVLFSLFIINSNSIGSKQFLVKDKKEFNEAVKNATPGDEIILANGVWNDTELVFKQKGTKEQP